MEVAGRRAASSVLSELRLALVARRLATQPTAADGTQSGEIAAAAVQGVEALEAYFARYLPQVVLASIVPFAVVAWVATVDLESAARAGGHAAARAGVHVADRPRHRAAHARALARPALPVDGLPRRRARPAHAARRSIAAARRPTRIAEVSERHRRATMGTLRLTFLSGTVLELAATLGVALVAVTAGVRLVDGSLGLQAGLTVLVLAPEVYLPLRRLGAEYHASADGLAVADRMLGLLDAPVATLRGRAATGAEPRGGAGAPGARRLLLSGARRAACSTGSTSSWRRARPWRSWARAGPARARWRRCCSGSWSRRPGASRPAASTSRAAGSQDWRALVAWVPQHPALVRGSVADNIRLGRAASDRAVRAAAALAGADAFVGALPGGYATVVGDGGRPLSPGERRRIGLARAFLGDPPLVVLDEPTADLDPASVEHVSRAVRRLGAGRTVLLIAHRPELVAHADRIVRLEAGAAVAVPARRAA